MVLKLYNTRTRKKEEFRPLDPSNVRMYVCGPTVYDYAHIGNARPVIVFDVLFRLLRHIYGADHVTYVRNITDVDDKINARAAELYPDMPPEAAIRKLTEETTAQFHKDVAALGCLPPTEEPRATDYIAQMKEMITRLNEADIAYVADDHVLFSVAAYGKLKNVPRYGSLARRSLDEMIAGARVEVAPYKRDAMDFVLWKPSKDGEPGWPSPLNIRTPGRPGWHLECSAMSKALLGDEFDIHGGGIDLVFPHHENEVAQSCGAHGTHIMANIWMHNGHLQVEGEKMSKSLGNFVTIHDHVETAKFGGRSWPGVALRFAMLRTHHRQPIDWTQRALHEAYAELQSWAYALTNSRGSLNAQGRNARGLPPKPDGELIEILEDDLNLPGAIAWLRGKYSQLKDGDELASTSLMEGCEFLGILRSEKLLAFNPHHVGDGVVAINPSLVPLLDNLQTADLNGDEERKATLLLELKGKGVIAEIGENGAVSYRVMHGGLDVDEAIRRRLAARKAANWAEADRIRDELAAMGIALKDAKDPATGEIVTTWEIAR
ncbi:MAG: cysteine--tRNA ligase [Rhodomicrobiaceae bacterium]